ncbi:fimbria/pilus outer membrane usher protein [Salinivibrio kushneri]|uniref:fimbria/pilus outer membrane usher protein n=1 Tax=Salinivibrio kushneri TaxID=1908198 RepID=UPI0015E0EE98|nr:fimbria/pilus outer membrane usher protein [Salinivibrio kushneri]
MFVYLMANNWAHANDEDVASVDQDAFEFDESLLLGYPQEGAMDGILQNVLRQSQFEAGEYSLDVYLNARFFRRQLVELVRRGEDVVPCLSRETWQTMGVLAAHTRVDEITQCWQADGYRFQLNQSKLALKVTVPQAYTQQQPNGYIAPAQWDDGEAVFFTNYDTNYYRSHMSTDAGGGDNDSLFVGVRTGVNVDRWRVRSQFNYSYNNAGNRTQRQLRHGRTYVTTAIAPWESELTFGQIYTSDSLFDGVSFDGAELHSDPRMLPMSRRGYAPVIVGMANTVATVTVSQQGREIHQQTVPAGPFEIREITSPFYRGDFDVVVEEADGQVKRFTVPFQAVPGSMRPGQSRYGLAAGKLRLTDVVDEPYFAQGVYERGLTNRLTSHVGLRVAEDYLGTTFGAVLGTSVGAFGLRSSLSAASMGNHTDEGWRAGIDYSVDFEQTDTTVTLASYRYSSYGYRSLSDFARWQAQDARDAAPSLQAERDFFSLNVDQSMPGRGRLNFSGSHTVYRGDQDSTTQAQLSYSTQIGRATVNVGYLRSFERDNSTADDVLSLGVSLPLGGRQSSTLANFSVQTSKEDTRYQAGVSGQLAGWDQTSYGVNYSRNDDQLSMVSMNVNHLSPKGAYGATLSRSDDYTQWGVSARGGLVIHQGGMNMTESLGETFALIKADGAEGATIRYARGGVIEDNGYGIANHLAPYKYNQVSLDPSTVINPDIELQETQFRVVPTAGASVVYEVPTTMGKAVLLQIQGDKRPPLGADIVDEQGRSIGMVSQNGLAYVRVATLTGKLTIEWGQQDSQRCVIPYDLTTEPRKVNRDFVTVSAACQEGE